MTIRSLLNPRTCLAATAAACVLLSLSAATPGSAATARANQASTNANSCAVYTYNWYLENASTYSVMMDTSNSTFVAVHQLQRFGNVIWNFCRVGTNNGDPVFELVDEGTYGVVGDCAADAGPTLEDGNVAYFEFKPCSAAGTSFIERPLSSGNGFRLESLYQLNNTGRVEYITVRSPSDNYRLFLAAAGGGWNVWNGAPCPDPYSC